MIQEYEEYVKLGLKSKDEVHMGHMCMWVSVKSNEKSEKRPKFYMDIYELVLFRNKRMHTGYWIYLIFGGICEICLKSLDEVHIGYMCVSQ